MSKNKETSEAYIRQAEKWALSIRSGKNIARDYLEKPAMHRNLPDLEGKKVLCVGCGTGEECEYLSHKKGQVIGVDVSDGLIQYAKRSYPDIDFHVMDMEDLKFDNESFDYLYSSLVIHYAESWKRTLSEAKRVLKKGGIFLFSTHHPVKWGAENKRSDKERSILLGYKKQFDTNKVEVFGDYLNTRRIDDVWFGDFPVTFYHRSLESIFYDILESGFVIKKFLEPKAISEVKEIDPMFYQERDKVPIFMIFELQKL